MKKRRVRVHHIRFLFLHFSIKIDLKGLTTNISKNVNIELSVENSQDSELQNVSDDDLVETDGAS
jgi:hypothetical protein